MSFEGLYDFQINLLYPKKTKKTVFTACNINYKDGSYQVDLKDKKQGTSAILTNMLNDCALLYQKEKSDTLNIGDIVEVIKI